MGEGPDYASEMSATITYSIFIPIAKIPWSVSLFSLFDVMYIRLTIVGSI